MKLSSALRTAVVLASAASLATLTGCAATASPEPAEDLALTSPDLDADGRLPDWATNSVAGYCTGENRSPDLAWTGAPEGTESFALAMTDPANSAYRHWIVTAIPADATGLASAEDGAIGVGITGSNWQGPGRYAGVCVDDNPYLYTLYALDEPIEGDASTTYGDLLELIDGHVLAEATLSAMPADRE
ncbi:YbhB/YbcL family Raf kinase inhibitor-like protein [Agromyces marinus]|uniref:YbhB/YbcL family Raf kinase inhibitor-like protein n=1 Tax=Agromyces marinus TaxID=1389020 RepID=A0ABN6YJT4_9MICO|nr:YbhB/YbcL family Raf kinase inhibitor-like protein [Agromyces marinus]UIP59210.1 hypothetical protein DSM26151_21110 [Agromyces marinus]BDZ55788.1 hypothetical protein GCM10025870_28610 [Agromyces marinus]